MKIRTKKFEDAIYYIAAAMIEFDKDDMPELSERKQKAVENAKQGFITVYELLAILGERY